MKLYRYMSNKELQKLMAGIKMYPNVNFHKAKTDSEGFCFLGEKTIVQYGDEDYCFSPENCIRFLSGIVTNEVLVEFEANVSLVKESWGCYSDPFGDYDDSIFITEYCAKTYDRDNFIPTRYALVPDFEVRNTIWYNL